MKKKLFLIIIICLCFTSTGCGKSLKTTKCSSIIDQSVNGYKINTNYIVHSKKGIVSTIEIEQVIESDKNDILEDFKTDLTTQYEKYNTIYGGYTFEFKEKDNKLILDITIDYDNLNMSKFILDNTSIKKYLNDDNKLTLDGVKKMYSTSNIKCK